ncbi:MAG: DUF3047 domain-containing protein [Pseudomonadota bacterium]
MAVLMAIVISACLPVERSPVQRHGNRVILLDPVMGLDDAWEHNRLRREDTLYEISDSELGKTLKATGQNSASILYRLFEKPGLDCDLLEWSWYVDNPQSHSNLLQKGKDDVAASLFVIFGDPGLFLDRSVPTLKYVWSNRQHQVGDVIAGPYHKKYIRSLIMQSGGASGQQMIRQQVNLRRDFQKVFEREAPERIFGVAIFTDNDDTQQPIEAHYGRIELVCRGV